MKTSRLILLLLVAGVFGLMAAYSFDSLSQYASFKEAQASGQEVHVVGEWIRQDEARTLTDGFQFYLQDSTNTTAFVHYDNPKPVNFESAEKVVVIGQYQGEIFKANKILMKCPSKYEENSIQAEAQPVSRPL